MNKKKYFRATKHNYFLDTGQFASLHEVIILGHATLIFITEHNGAILRV
jgi:hypothetical protein